MLLSLATPPAAYPVTVAEAKAHLRIEHALDDTYIETLIKAVTAELDGRQGLLRRALITQTWDYSLPWFPVVRRICVPMPPLQSVTSVKYFDANNVEQTFSSDNYEIIAQDEQGYIALKQSASWPGTYEREAAVTIRFVAGYGADGSAVPANVRAAMLLRIGELYANRGDEATSGDMSVTVKRLLNPSRRVLLA
jgi:uncharacterized phiE125 gp8 family phage protein